MSKKTVSYIFFILCFLIAFFPTYAQETKTVELTVIKDDLDREVEIPDPVTSVITLAPSLTETLYYLDALDLLTGCDIYSDYPEEVAELERVTNWDLSLNYEVLTAAQPDVILAAEINGLDQIKDLEQLGLTVFCIKNPADFDELYETIRLVGEVIGKEDKAEEVVKQMQDRVDAVIKAMEGNTNTPLVFYEMDATDPTKPWTAGKGTFISTILSLAGAKNLGDEAEGEWIQMGLENLIEASPEIILLGDYYYGNTPDAVVQRTGWDSIEAVKEGRMYGFDDNLVSRPGPRLVEGLEIIAEIIHPERFAGNKQ